MADTSNIPGEVIIKTVSFFSPKGTVNLVNLVVSISIYESIFTPGIMADVIVNESQGLATALPLVGGEKIIIEFQTPTLKAAKYELMVSQMSDAAVSQGHRSKAYAIKACSEEVAMHKITFIQKAYNTNISGMVKDILTTFLKTKKKLDIQETNGVQKILIPNLKPYSAIDFLRRRSNATQDKSSGYVFFENQQGIHFKTIERLFSEGSVGDRVFTKNPTINTDIKPSRFRNIIGFNQPQQHDHIIGLGNGSLNNQIKTFDFRTLKYEKKDTKVVQTTFKSADGQFKQMVASEFQSKYGSTPGTHSFIPVDTFLPKTHIPEGTSDQKGFASLVSQGGIHIHVNGDSTLTAGQLFEAQLMDTKGTTDNPEQNRLIAGKYMITAIRHIIGPVGMSPRFTTAIEGVKGGYKTNV